MRRYEIVRVRSRVPLAGRVAGTPWADARVARIDRYPWYSGGRKQSTVARAMYDADALYLQYRCRDRHISALKRKLNGNVYLDSCVEFFAAPAPGRDMAYFNLEMNCCGQILMHFGPTPASRDRREISAAMAKGIEIVTSVPGPRKAESPDDNGWWLAARVPFAAIQRFIRRPAKPKAGTIWRGNFYRCGGRTDEQFACWSPITAPAPAFHRPQFFGQLVFA